MMPPGIRTGEQPPYHRLDEYLFQELTCELLQAEPGIRTCDVYGRRGQLQRGIDLLAHRQDGGLDVGQCKRYQEFSERDIAAATDEFFSHWDYWSSLTVKRFVLFVSCSLDDRRQQEAILAQKARFARVGISYEAWSNRQITAKLRTQPKIVAAYLHPPEHWVSFICSPQGTASVPQTQESAVLNRALVSQVTLLTGHLSESIEQDLTEMRELILQGKWSEASSWVERLRSDQALWLMLPPEVQSKVIRLQASLELSKGRGGDAALSLLDEAESVSPSADGTRLRAHITFLKEGALAAIEVLGLQRDVDSLNLRAGLLIEAGDLKAAEDHLEGIIQEGCPNAETYRLRALLFLMSKNAALARVAILEALDRQPQWYSVRHSAAVIEFFSAVSPSAIPDVVPATPPVAPWHLVKRDRESTERLRSAARSFRELQQTPSLEQQEIRDLRLWELACLGNDLQSQDQATELCQDLLVAEPGNAQALMWVISRKWPIDLSAARNALQERVERGEFSPQDISVLLPSLLANNDTTGALDLMLGIKEKLAHIGQEGLWKLWYCQVQTYCGEAKSVLEVAESIQEPQYRVPAVLGVERALAAVSESWESYLTRLEAFYDETHDPSLLLELCELKARVGDWTFVLEKQPELFNKVETADSIELVATAYFNLDRFDACLDLLEDHRNDFPGGVLPARLRRLRIACRQTLGVLPQAVREAEDLVREDASTANLLLLAQAYFAHGDLKGVARLARQLATRSDLAAEQYYRLALLVQWDDHRLSVSLWKRAANSEPLPDELVAPMMSLAFQLGLDSDTTILMDRLNRLAAEGRAGIRQYSLEEVLDFFRERRESTRQIYEAYTAGRLPIHLLAQALNLSLADLYHGNLQQAETAPNPWSWSPLLCRHAGRSIPLQIDQVPSAYGLYMDASAILLGAHLDILDQVEATFRKITLPARIIPSLIRMRNQISPHQPSRMDGHEQIVQLAREGKLKTVEMQLSGVCPDASEVDLLGEAPATQLAFARNHGGYLVEFLPLKPNGGSELAATHPVFESGTIINCRALVESLRQDGPLSQSEYEQALQWMGTEGLSMATTFVPEQGHVVVLPGNLAEVLANGRVLRDVCDRFEVYVENDGLERSRAELESFSHRSSLSEWLGDIIERIRRGLETGSYEVMPEEPPPQELETDELPDSPELRCLYQLLHTKYAPNSLLWVDDRFMTGFPHYQGAAVIGISEILNALVQHGAIAMDQYYRLNDRLRASNIRFLPVTAEEITYHLNAATVKEGQLVETRELKNLRRYVSGCLAAASTLQRPAANPDASEVIVGEMPYLLSIYREVSDVIVHVWRYSNGDLTATDAKANWVVENLYYEHLALSALANLASDGDGLYVTGLSIAGLITGGLGFGDDRPLRGQYLSWVLNRVMSRRLKANPKLLTVVADTIRTMLMLDQQNDEGLTDDSGEPFSPAEARVIRRIIAQQFQEDLPDVLSDELNKDQEFAAFVGVTVVPVMEIDDLKFNRDELLVAVGEAINGRSESVYPLRSSAKAVIEPAVETPDAFIVTHPHYQAGVTVHDPVFGILKESPKEREVCLRDGRDWFDCSPERFDQVIARVVSEDNLGERMDAVAQWRENSVRRYYERIEKSITSRIALPVRLLEPPAGDKLGWFLRISPTTGSGEFLEAVDMAAECLVGELDLAEAYRRLAGLPLPLPPRLINLVKALDGDSQDSFITTVFRQSVSPVAKIHLIRLLQDLGGNKFRRLSWWIAMGITGTRGAREYEAFHAILQWLEGESSHWFGSEVSQTMRLACVWAHTHYMYSLFAAHGVSSRWIEETFGSLVHAVTPESFRRSQPYWSDVSHPRHLTFASFLVDGLGYAFSDESLRGREVVWSRVLSLAIIPADQVMFPDPNVIRDLSRSSNCLSAFLGQDRGSLLTTAVGERLADVLSTASVQALLQWAMGRLESHPDEKVSWGIVGTVLGDEMPPDTVLTQLEGLTDSTDFGILLTTDVESALAALLAVTQQCRWFRDKSTVNRLASQLVMTARLCHTKVFPEPQASRRLSQDASRFCYTLIECALSIAFHSAGDSVVPTFAGILEELLTAWPNMRQEARPLIQFLTTRLPISMSKHLWRIDNLCRSF